MDTTEVADSRPSQAGDIRREAERRLREKNGARVEGMAEADVRAVLHELQVHQIELEMQNEELLRARVELQAAADKYQDLFAFAPVGYFRLDEQGRILEINLAGAAMLGLDRSTAVQQRFGQFLAVEHRAAFAEFRQRVSASGMKQVCEIELRRNGAAVHVFFECVPALEGKGDRSLRVTATDISVRKRAEQDLASIAQFPAENPNPVLRLGNDGQVLFANCAAELLMTDLGWQKGEAAPPVFREIVETTLRAETVGEVDMHCVAGRVVSFSCVPLANRQYVNLYARDVTDARRAEQESAESRQRLAAIVGSAMDAIISVDTSWRIVLFNAAAETMFRCSAAEAVGQPLERFIPERFRAAHVGHVRAFGEAGVTGRTMGKLNPLGALRADGEEFPMEASISQGEIGGQKVFTCILRDITLRKQAEGFIRATNALLRILPEKFTRTDYMDTVVELLHNWTGCRCAGIRGIDAQGRIPYEAYTGFSQEFWGQENLLMLHRGQCACTRLILGETLPQDAPAMTPGGSFVCSRLSEFARHLSREDAAHFRGSCAKSGFESLALIPLRHQGQVLGVIHLADEARDKLPPKTVEFLESLSPLIGAAIHRLNLEDALQRSEGDLRQAKLAAEAANVAKSRFLANMSHELRTPMNAILGMIDVALPKAADPVVQDCLQTARGSADLLLTMLNELLDSAKIESGKLEVESAPFSLRQMLEQVTRVVSVRAGEKGLACHCRVHDETPDLVVGDRMRLQQVLLNLAGNAVKFTAQGEVVVRVEDCKLQIANCKLQIEDAPGMTQDPGPNDKFAICNLQFAISDTGIGISPAAVERLFQPFAQAEASTARRFGGTGLGLSICKGFVEAMGGRIWVESEAGKGSTFFFTVRLPLAKELPPDFEVPAALPAAAPAKLRILLVEDNPANQKVATYFLHDRGHHVEIAGDGQEAIDLTARNRYDVVLMDVEMPEMDGLEATAAIRAREYAGGEHTAGTAGGGRLPIIAMTAHAMPGDRDRCLAAGMDGYLSKPVNAQELIGLVEGLARRAAAGSTDGHGHDPLSPLTDASPRALAAVFNPQEAVKRCDSEDMVRMMIQHFFAEVDDLFPQMRAALDKGDLVQVGRLGHRMKGTVLFLGARPAEEAAQRVERFCQPDGGSPLEAEEAVNALEQQCRVLKAVLQAHPLAAGAEQCD